MFLKRVPKTNLLIYTTFCFLMVCIPHYQIKLLFLFLQYQFHDDSCKLA